MSVATLRTATGSLFGAVTASAGSVSSLFTAVTHGIAMLDGYAKHALDQQQDRILADNTDFRSRLMEEKASEMSERQLRIVEFCNQSPVHKELYAKNYDLIGAAFAKQDAARAKEGTST